MTYSDPAMVKSSFERIPRADALALGLPRYFTGEPCKRGHVAERHVVNCTCVECQKAIAKRRIAKKIIYMKGWIAAHPAEIAATNKRRYLRERDARIIAASEYQRRNREKVNAKNSQWRKANPGKVNAQTARRRASIIRATPPWLTDGHLYEIRTMYELAALFGLEVDHIVPLRGKAVCGLHVPWNLQFLSKPANCSKGNRHAA